MLYNFAADSFYIMKLCSRLFVLRCRNRPKYNRSRHFDPHFEEVGGGVELWWMARWKALAKFLELQARLPTRLYAVVLAFLTILSIWVTVHILLSPVRSTRAVTVQWSSRPTSTHLALQCCYGHDLNKLFLFSRPRINGLIFLLFSALYFC